MSACESSSPFRVALGTNEATFGKLAVSAGHRHTQTPAARFLRLFQGIALRSAPSTIPGRSHYVGAPHEPGSLAHTMRWGSRTTRSTGLTFDPNGTHEEIDHTHDRSERP
jgi:hypothetical protein